jgi:hypothetical protein
MDTEQKVDVVKERQDRADAMKLNALQAKLKALQTAKFEDEGQRATAIARCQAGIDELKNASASSNQGGKEQT